MAKMKLFHFIASVTKKWAKPFSDKGKNVEIWEHFYGIQ